MARHGNGCKKEAIVNKAQDKGIEEYAGLMSEVFSEAHRTLKRHWFFQFSISLG